MLRSDQLLLPANAKFIAFSLGLALLLHLLPLGPLSWWPDLLALCIAFWCVHQPNRIGVGMAFFLGLIADVGTGAMLGQHALAYCVLAFSATSLSRRILWFPLISQTLRMLPLFVMTVVLQWVVRLLWGGTYPDLLYVLAPVLQTLLWPLATLLLLAPQFRTPDKDEHRPL